MIIQSIFEYETNFCRRQHYSYGGCNHWNFVMSFGKIKLMRDILGVDGAIIS